MVSPILWLLAFPFSVKGGENNEAIGTQFATVVGGSINTARASYSTVVGGFRNKAYSNFATVAGTSIVGLSLGMRWRMRKCSLTLF